MKKSNIIKYSTLSLVSICAIVAVVLLASTAIAHGCSYGDSSCYSGSYNTGYNNGYGSNVYGSYGSDTLYGNNYGSYGSNSYYGGSYGGGCSSCGGYNYVPTYSYSNMYQYAPSSPIISPLTATCYSQPISAYVGSSVQYTNWPHLGCHTI